MTERAGIFPGASHAAVPAAMLSDCLRELDAMMQLRFSSPPR
ncbi:hypothetical protein [Serratia marcescens]